MAKAHKFFLDPICTWRSGIGCAEAVTRETTRSKLRSSEWFFGDDETALSHRVVMKSVGLETDPSNARPIIGIADSSSDLNPCNLPLRKLVDEVKRGVLDAGGLPVAFPVMSLGEDLMKPSAMLYRNLLSMEVEEYLRAYPIDGVVLLANCDKSVPGSLMGAASANLPTVMLTAGARPVPVFRGKRIGTGTDLWRKWADLRAGKIDEAEWKEFEACLDCGLGSCNTMGTASSVAIMVEVLGLTLPGTSTIPAGTPERDRAAYESGVAAVRMVQKGITPAQVLTPAAFRNAARVLHACGGSTNAIIHLLAISGRVGGDLTLGDVSKLGEHIPVLADVLPSGEFLIQDFHAAGGTPALMAKLMDHLELEAITLDGETWLSHLPESTVTHAAIRNMSDPLKSDGAFAVVKGSLAPRGALIKTSAASSSLMKHRGHAVVFSGYEDMRMRIDDLTLNITPDSVLVLAGCGAVGVPGMPEWGMIPIPKHLAEQGLRMPE
jgi:dihydroxyacid dehydratase/phosphogluconate dehydratase